MKHASTSTSTSSRDRAAITDRSHLPGSTFLRRLVDLVTYPQYMLREYFVLDLVVIQTVWLGYQRDIKAFGYVGDYVAFLRRLSVEP